MPVAIRRLRMNWCNGSTGSCGKMISFSHKKNVVRISTYRVLSDRGAPLRNNCGWRLTCMTVSIGPHCENESSSCDAGHRSEIHSEKPPVLYRMQNRSPKCVGRFLTPIVYDRLRLPNRPGTSVYRGSLRFPGRSWASIRSRDTYVAGLLFAI